ncbi:MAG TPA: potassium-transporting ATPase subunit KdpC [Magnetospirillaceae bacterium]|nr:potassium-transporting ATPase subunit KdpC [Magnetospirillaceae bacterium]
MTLVLGIGYPLAMTYLSGALFPQQAHGSLITKADGTVIGSELIGQNFTGASYFHGRPSATTDTDPNDSTKTVPAPYNAASSNASNAAPSSKALLADVQSRIEALKTENPDAKGEVPVDLVTSSASGLDPHISVAGAAYQVPRVAKARGMSEEAVAKLVQDNVEGRTFGLLGEPRVNVLKLNLALDSQGPAK